MFAYIHPTSILLLVPPFSDTPPYFDTLSALAPTTYARDYEHAADVLNSSAIKMRSSQPKLTLLEHSANPEGGVELTLRLDRTHPLDQYPSASAESPVSVLVVDTKNIDGHLTAFLSSIAHMNFAKALIVDDAAKPSMRADHSTCGFHNILSNQDTQDDLLLRTVIRKLQIDFLKRQNASWTQLLSAGLSAYLTNAAVNEFIDSVASKAGASYVFLSTSPPGILATYPGDRREFIVFSDPEYRRAQMEVAGFENAPRALVQELSDPSRIALFPSPLGLYSKASAKDWHQHIYDGVCLDAELGWYFARVTNPEVVGALIDGPLKLQPSQ